MGEITVNYDAPPTLSTFLDANDFVRVVVGPVGSGKSSACVLEVLRRASEQAPGPDGVRRTRFAIIRNTYGQLRDTTRKTFEQWVPAPLGKWNEQAFTFHMRFGDVDCEVLFRALDRPEDVKKLLSLELTGAYLNEVREIPKSVLDVLETRVGRYPAKVQGGASWFGIWADTNPWHSTHWAAKLFRGRPEGYRLFRQPGGREANAENVEHLPAGYYTRLVAGKDAEWVKVYIDGQDATADVGAIWGALVDALEGRGGLAPFDHATDHVLTSWDIGITDSCGIWFWRLGSGRTPEIIDHYENHGQPFSHYADVVDGRGYTYARHWLPHDARAKSFQTGASTVELALARWPGAVGITPQLSLADGIGAARWLLEQPIRIHPRCEKGIEALREYRYEWDEEDRAFSRRPLHNWASHSADAFRYLAAAYRAGEALTRPRVPSPPPRSVRTIAKVTLDEMFAVRGDGPKERA